MPATKRKRNAGKAKATTTTTTTKPKGKGGKGKEVAKTRTGKALPGIAASVVGAPSMSSKMPKARQTTLTTGPEGGLKLNRPPPRQSYNQLVVEAVTNLNNPEGSSIRAVKKYLADAHHVSGRDGNEGIEIRRALDKAVEDGLLVQPKTRGKGKAGLYKLALIGVNVGEAASAKKPEKKTSPKGRKRASPPAEQKPEAVTLAKAPSRPAVKTMRTSPRAKIRASTISEKVVAVHDGADEPSSSSPAKKRKRSASKTTKGTSPPSKRRAVVPAEPEPEPPSLPNAAKRSRTAVKDEKGTPPPSKTSVVKSRPLPKAEKTSATKKKGAAEKKKTSSRGKKGGVRIGQATATAAEPLPLPPVLECEASEPETSQSQGNDTRPRRQIKMPVLEKQTSPPPSSLRSLSKKPEPKTKTVEGKKSTRPKRQTKTKSTAVIVAPPRPARRPALTHAPSAPEVAGTGTIKKARQRKRPGKPKPPRISRHETANPSTSASVPTPGPSSLPVRREIIRNLPVGARPFFHEMVADWEYCGTPIRDNLDDPEWQLKIRNGMWHHVKQLSGGKLIRVVVQSQEESEIGKKSILIKIQNYDAKRGKMIHHDIATTKVTTPSSFRFNIVNQELAEKLCVTLLKLKQASEIVFGMVLVRRGENEGPKTGEDMEQLILQIFRNPANVPGLS